MKNRTLPCIRKHFALIAFMLFLAFNATADPVGAERARLVAKHFLSNNDARSTGLRDLSAEAGFAHLYVFSTESSFVLVAGDDCIQPVLGYSLNGSFDLDHMPENAAAWIQEYSDAIQYAVEHQTRATSEVLQQWNDLAAGRPEAGRATTVVAPLLTTQWDQGNPYNLLCPTGTVTGCVATAMAQVMKYWEYPSHGIGSHSYVHDTYGELSADFQNTTYDWDNMLDTYNGNGTSTQNMAVATLMYHCGVSVNMDYGTAATGGSGAVTAYVADALKTYFNYSSETQHYDRADYDDDTWINMLKADLDQNRPIQYHGRGTGGHSFVFDGYNSENKFHVNWGWSGYQDGYYSINGMSPGTGGTGSGSGTYNQYQGAVLGIHPSDCVAADPANLTYTQSGRDITLSWTAASGAVSYNVYCDNTMIGNTASTTFSHVAAYGSSSYFVRSVDANGALSLSSNAVSVTVDYQTPVVNDLQAAPMGNSVNLSWSSPEWCYPETPSDTLTYGGGNYDSGLGYNNGTTCLYWGHRYPASSLSAYDNMGVYKVSFYAVAQGSYKVYVYQGTTSDHPQTLLAQQTVSTMATGWVDIELSNPIQIDATQDLWVFMYDPEARSYPGAFCSYSGNEGNYYSTSPTSWANHYSTNSGNVAFLIRTLLTDGVYTYNLYRNGSSIASSLSDTTYTDSNLAPGTYNYYVKTNYYGGETNASNQVTVQIGAGNYYTINATANPTAGGTVSGAGSYLEGGSCTLTATANPGYSFVNWTKGQQVVSTNATYTFTVNQAGSYVANFEAASYQITATAVPAAGGTVSGTGTFGYNQTCTLVATPAEGYVFASWTKNGNEVSTETTYSFSVTESGAYLANFDVAPTMVQIGAGTDTTYFFPFYTYYNYSIATALFTATELEEAGALTTPMTSLSWYAISSTGDLQQNITIWMANVSDAAVSSTSPIASGMTKVYTGSSTPEVGWNRFGFNEDSFAWDGESNVLILCQRNNGTWNYNPIQWQSHNTSFYSTSYLFTDESAYNVESTSYSNMYRSGIRPNTQFEMQTPAAGTNHTTALASGWNWWSSYIELSNINGLEMLENSLGEAGIRIQSRNQYTDNYGTYGWYGQLTAINNEQSYRIRTNGACSAVITGQETMPENHPITINNGWSWIGYPSAQSTSVSAALSGFVAEPNDQIKGRNGYATYYSTYGWYGTLDTLVPGQGYMYKSNATTAKTLVFQTGRNTATKANLTSEGNLYTPNSAEYADNMTITAVVELDGEELRSEAYELAAFVGDECRGSVKLKYVEPIDRYVAFLLVYGDVEEELNFVLTDGKEALRANGSYMFSANGTIGSGSEPVKLDFGTLGLNGNEANLVLIYPNPSNGVFHIEGKDIRSIEVINVFGQTIISKATTDEHLQLNLSGSASGMYLLRVVTDNGIITNQLIKY